MKTRSVFALVLIGLIALAVTSSGRAATPVAAEPNPAPKAAYQLYLPMLVRGGAAPTGAPTITSFSAAPSTISAGGTSTLAWSASGATSLSIAPGVGTVTGTSVQVHPTATTQYVLTATNASGSATASASVTVSGGGGGGGSAAFWLPYNTVDSSIVTTYGMNVAVDGAGGIHGSYSIYTGLDSGTRPAYYVYCSTNCTNPASWVRTRLSNYVQDVRLALDPAGHPRLLLFISGDPNTVDGDKEYRYAACDSACTNSASWTITTITTVWDTAGKRSYQNNHYFALDDQGHPAFLYADYSNGHNGTFYAHCTAACTAASNWAETTIADGQWFLKEALAFAPGGKPRLALDNFAWNEAHQQYSTNLIYLACDSACDNPANWASLSVAESIGNGEANFSLQIDSNGRPRIALYTGNYVSAPLLPYQLHYIWCNAACTSPVPDAWGVVRIGLPDNNGADVDLKLDTNNRPRMVYDADGAGLGYAWCNSNCESTGAQWSNQMLEATSVIVAQYPPFPPRQCPNQTWFNGKRPSLAFDSAGNPRVGYDAERWWGGIDAYGNHCDIDVPVARMGLFNQP